MNSETNLKRDITQVVSYRHFNSETHAPSQDVVCGVTGVQSDTVGSFTQSTSSFPIIIIPLYALIYHRSYKIFKIDSTLCITHFLPRSRKYCIHKLQATNSFPLHDLDLESDSLFTTQQTQEMSIEYLSISYVTYQVIRKNCAF